MANQIQDALIQPVSLQFCKSGGEGSEVLATTVVAAEVGKVAVKVAAGGEFVDDLRDGGARGAEVRLGGWWVAFDEGGEAEGGNASGASGGGCGRSRFAWRSISATAHADSRGCNLLS